MSMQHRGPDSSTFRVFYLDSSVMVALGFHRLAINGQAKADEQPFSIGNTHLICNGEIWNHPKLSSEAAKANKAPDQANKASDHANAPPQSDCKCLLPYYQQFGIRQLCTAIDGVFGCVIYDESSDTTHVLRDPIGIRSLYWHQHSETNALMVASELKSFPCEYENVMPFPPGQYATLSASTSSGEQLLEFGRYVEDAPPNAIIPICSSHDRLTCIRESLTDAVRKRFMSDRPVGCILSGGLDSTLITAIACRLYKAKNPSTTERMRTYTIGMAGGEDLKWARMAADYLGTEHHEFVVAESEFLDAIPEVIAQIESFDVTTVRASVGNWLVAKKIAELGKDTVLFCGDFADELLGGYRGFGMAHTAAEFKEANQRMIRDVHCFDVLRSEKSFAGHGLEGRVPFADKRFRAVFDTYAPTAYRMWGGLSGEMGNEKIEKHILREAFEGYLPAELLWRRKEAFSDGVSGEKRSWFAVIQDHIQSTGISSLLTREHMCPYDAESSYYRAIYESSYSSVKCIPYFWKQPFTTEIDPSARKLSNY